MDLSFLIGAEVITKSCCQGIVEAVSGTDVTVFLPETGERRKYSARSTQSGSIYDRNFLYVKNPELNCRMASMLAEEEEEIHDLLACYDD